MPYTWTYANPPFETSRLLAEVLGFETGLDVPWAMMHPLSETRLTEEVACVCSTSSRTLVVKLVQARVCLGFGPFKRQLLTFWAGQCAECLTVWWSGRINVAEQTLQLNPPNNLLD